MLKILTTSAIREIEALAVEEGISEAEMMQRAGTALARSAAAYLRTLPPEVQQPRVTLLIGPGNNGGDGLVAGKVLAESTNALVRFYLTRKRDDDPLMQPILDAGHLVVVASDDLRYRVLTQLVASADLVVDALYGIGTTPPLRTDASKLLRAATQALREKPEPPPTWLIEPATAPPQPPRPYIIACDCPSGLNADTGEIDAQALPADETVTFIAPKPGLLAFPGASSIGKLKVAPLGLPEKLKPFKDAKAFLVDAAHVASVLPPRPVDAHKGTFGKTLIVGGSVNYIGAPALAAEAAYRSGAGLVTIAAPADIVEAHAGQRAEVTWLVLPSEDGVIAEDAARILAKGLGNADAIVLGPGMGTEATTSAFLTALVQGGGQPRVSRSIGFQPTVSAAQPKVDSVLRSLVIDADALNLLAARDGWHRFLPANTILTPHPGEMARLCAMTRDDVQMNRLPLVLEKAKAWKAVIVLKGAHTIIASPYGQAALLPFKTSALSKAGTGDVLAGLCGGFLAQGLSPFNAAVCAAYLHGYAGEMAQHVVGSARSVIASDVLAHIGTTLEHITGRA
jgi:NAD(P)H-hydrate epimerase